MKQLDLGRDGHMHSLFSDGCAPIETMARTAIERGLTQIVITDHMPLPFETRFCVQPSEMAAYRRDVLRLKNQLSDRLEVLLGMEMEYLPSCRSWVEGIAALGWDRLIGSVHFVEKGGRAMILNGSRSEFETALRELFGGDGKSLVTAYYRQLQRVVNSGLFHVVGHFDVIRKHNRGARFFDDQAAWYRELVLETIEAVERQGMQVELNLGGLRFDIGETFPSGWVLAEVCRRGIPVVMGSDAHRPEHIGAGRVQGLDDIQRLCA